MGSSQLSVVRTFPDSASAEAAKALLVQEGLRAFIDPQDPISGPLASAHRGVRLLVPTGDAARAASILDDTEFTDGELGYLATGRLGPNE